VIVGQKVDPFKEIDTVISILMKLIRTGDSCRSDAQT